jgi:hypothetical protein
MQDDRKEIMPRPIIVTPWETDKDGDPVSVIFIDLAAKCNTYRRVFLNFAGDALQFDACMN